MAVDAAVNPLLELSDLQLWNGQVLIGIICNRGKFATTKKRADALCEIGKALKVEADQRGLPSPGPGHTTGQFDNPPYAV